MTDINFESLGLQMTLDLSILGEKKKPIAKIEEQMALLAQVGFQHRRPLVYGLSAQCKGVTVWL